MPELPEVETVARQLKPFIEKKKVIDFVVHDDKLKNISYKKLMQSRVSRVFRVGKEIVLELRKNKKTYYLSIHLRMSGRLIWVPNKSSDMHSKWVRSFIKFSGGQLRFVDPRRFGTFKFAENIDDLKPKGIDPITDTFTKNHLGKMLENSKQEIKTFLLRQDRIVGLGNIYASEILYASKISPKRLCRDISEDEVFVLLRNTKKILKKAIKNCGTTFSDFQGANGELGSYQKYLDVYAREGEQCKSCKKMIVRIVQQQRSTFYCLECQK